MFDRKLSMSIVAGMAAVWVGAVTGHMSRGSAWWYYTGFVALVALLTGGFGLAARGFFGGLMGSLLCLLIFGLAGDAFGKYQTFLAWPLLSVWVLGVAGSSFLLGRLVYSAHPED
jgi:hypothetical protein